MPIVDGKYKNPRWNNGSTPAINSTELNAMSDSIVANQEKASNNESEIKKTNEKLQRDYATKKYSDGIVYTASGNVNITVEGNCDYSLTTVTSLTMVGAAVHCHGFISFGSVLPIITISGFAASSGDDITAATANEVWEFSVYPFDGNSYIIWKKWSA